MANLYIEVTFMLKKYNFIELNESTLMAFCNEYQRYYCNKKDYRLYCDSDIRFEKVKFDKKLFAMSAKTKMYRTILGKCRQFYIDNGEFEENDFVQTEMILSGDIERMFVEHIAPNHHFLKLDQKKFSLKFNEMLDKMHQDKMDESLFPFADFEKFMSETLLKHAIAWCRKHNLRCALNFRLYENNLTKSFKIPIRYVLPYFTKDNEHTQFYQKDVDFMNMIFCDTPSQEEIEDDEFNKKYISLPCFENDETLLEKVLKWCDENLIEYTFDEIYG